LDSLGAEALLDHLDLQLAGLKENATQVETAAQIAAAEKMTVPSFERRKPARRPLPEHLPRERLVQQQSPKIIETSCAKISQGAPRTTPRCDRQLV
jgi:hypothetical protein